MYVPTPRPVSPQAQDLGQRLAQLVRDYRAMHPATSEADVQQAFLIARHAVGGNPRPALVAVAVGLAGAALAGLLIVGRSAGWTFAPVILVGLGILAVGIAAVKLGR